MSKSIKTRVKVADEVWIASALLHRENPTRGDFSVDEIVQRAAKEQVTEELRPGVYVHVVQHCVANRPANPGRYRMLFETEPGRRRLFRKGDPYHSSRANSKIVPDMQDLPDAYSGLATWYQEWEKAWTGSLAENDPLLALSGSGRDLWADEHADEYVRRLRGGWE